MKNILKIKISKIIEKDLKLTPLIQLKINKYQLYNSFLNNFITFKNYPILLIINLYNLKI